MIKPSQQFPLSPSPVLSKAPLQTPDPLLYPAAFDQLIRQRGVRFTHYRAAPCPNVLDIDTQAHDPNCTLCENGFIMYSPKQIIGVFGNNTLERIFQARGQWELGNAVVTFPAEYDDGSQADFQAFDKLVCDGYTHRTWELVQYDQRDGIDYVRYPILSVELVRTKDRIYQQGVDFEVVAGNGIRWLPGGDRPLWMPDIDKGEVYSIVYCANPQYYVVQLMHEIRATQAKDPAAAGKIAVRLPQQVLVRRDFLYQQLQRDHNREHRATEIVTDPEAY